MIIAVMIHWFIKHPTAVPEVPDSCTAILSPCIHPFPLFLETNTCHIFWYSFIVNNRVWIAWIKVIHANMLIPCNKQETDTLVTQHIERTSKLMFRMGSITISDVLKSIRHSENYSPKLCHNNWHPPTPWQKSDSITFHVNLGAAVQVKMANDYKLELKKTETMEDGSWWRSHKTAQYIFEKLLQ